MTGLLRVATVSAPRDALREALLALTEVPGPLGRPEEGHVRVAFAYRDADDFERKRQLALAADLPTDAPRLVAHAVHVSAGARPKVAFMFPGQGSQYRGMLRGLSEASPIVGGVFAEADHHMAPLLGRALSGVAFGTDPAAHDLLDVTEFAQAAVLAADVALARWLAALGFRADLLVGHSLGDYAAFVTAGALTLDAALTAVSMRGPEVARIDAVDPGAMASVAASEAVVTAVLAGVSGYVVAANKNATSQTVISGETAAVQAAIGAFRAHGIEAARIPVSHAFHSAILDAAAEPMARAVYQLASQPPEIPVISSVSGALCPPNARAVLDLLARQITRPVEFVAALETAYALGARLMVEVGPNRVLSGFARDVLGPRGVSVIALDHPWRSDALADGVAALWAATCVVHSK